MRQRNQRLPSSIPLSVPHARGETSFGKTRQKLAQEYEILLAGEFYGAHDFWTEYLCMESNKGGSITLTSRSREALDAQSGEVLAQAESSTIITRRLLRVEA